MASKPKDTTPPKDAFGREIFPGDAIMFAKLRYRSAEMYVGVVQRTTPTSATAAMTQAGYIEAGKKKNYSFYDTRILNVQESIKLTPDAVVAMGLAEVLGIVRHQIENPPPDGYIKFEATVPK